MKVSELLVYSRIIAVLHSACTSGVDPLSAEVSGPLTAGTLEYWRTGDGVGLSDGVVVDGDLVRRLTSVSFPYQKYDRRDSP